MRLLRGEVKDRKLGVIIVRGLGKGRMRMKIIISEMSEKDKIEIIEGREIEIGDGNGKRIGIDEEEEKEIRKERLSMKIRRNEKVENGEDFCLIGIIKNREDKILGDEKLIRNRINELRYEKDGIFGCKCFLGGER